MEELIKEVEEAGYKKYTEGVRLSTVGVFKSVCLLQKKFTGLNKTKYFINVYMYDYRIYSAIPLEFTATCQIQLYKGDDTFDIEFNTKSPKHAENLAEDFWGKMNMDFDHNN